MAHPFSRIGLSTYFINRIAVTNIQAREHLAQAQRIKEEEKLNNSGKPRLETRARHETKRSCQENKGNYSRHPT
jgi:hypothetical protein